jgi:hypothetical protein
MFIFHSNKNNYFNNPNKSCFNNTLKQQINTINYFHNLKEPNDCMFQAICSITLTTLSVCIFVLCRISDR